MTQNATTGDCAAAYAAIRLRLEKLSRYDRPAEPCTVAIPLPAGACREARRFAVINGKHPVPTQCRVTGTWPDGSVKWLLVHALVDLPGNAAIEFGCGPQAPPLPAEPVAVESGAGGATLRSGRLVVSLGGPGQPIFSRIRGGGPELEAGALAGPRITDADGAVFSAVVGGAGWTTIEAGPIRAVVQTHGTHIGADSRSWLDHTIRIYLWAGKPWLRIDYRIINREAGESVTLAGMGLSITPAAGASGTARTALATSNYRSRIRLGVPGEVLEHMIDAEQLVYEANEQVPEVLYGTFWADWCDPSRGGVAVTLHQAHQNFPKALRVDGSGIGVALLPAGHSLSIARGMAKTHRLFLHVHGADTSLEAVNVRSLQFQMPDQPLLPAAVYRAADVMEAVWVDRPVRRVEQFLLDLADRRTRGYGMLNWGDGPDAGYTEQGRGHGELVWTNNEYDLPHAALLMLARTGERRFLDYLLVAAEHWMDVDVCHDSDDPARRGGQLIHSARHVSGDVTLSHEWVEGLLDYWHLTGERVALETALGIGENVLRGLEAPELQSPGGAAARVTGWALRTLVALWLETGEARWLAPAERIADQFEAWQKEYGAWLAPYTDHTLARVPFMIAIAANSLMRYHSVRPEPRVASMIVAAARDLVEHSLLADGRFYYKELPSLQRRGAGSQVLEALGHAYELSGDATFLRAGLATFAETLTETRAAKGYSGPKFAVGDAVIWPVGPGPKNFAALALPVLVFYRHAVAAGLLAATGGGGGSLFFDKTGEAL